MNKNRRRNLIPRIMVVDDEKDILSIIKRGLESDNVFKVDTFSNGESALQAFESHSEYYYDIILTDIRMPKMNGLVLCKKLRKIDSKVKVCFITAGEMVFDFALRKFPDSAILKKPIDNYDLIKEVTRMTNA